MERIEEQVMELGSSGMERRDFLKSVGKGIALTTAAGAVLSASNKAYARPIDERIKQIASNSYAVNRLFKRRSRRSSTRPMSDAQKARMQELEQFKQKYGEITMLDFPQWTKDTYPGVTKMDLWDPLFGDIDDESQFSNRGFDPSLPSSKRYLDKLADKIVTTGVMAKHISNNAPRSICEEDEEARKEGIRVAKIWLDAAKQIGVQSMRVNTGGPRIAPSADTKEGYSRNREIVPYLKRAIESFKEMADYGEKVGVKVTIENHWGIAAHPMNVRIIVNEVNSPYCETSPDFCNWEHEYMLYHGLEALIPLASSMVHAKRWTRYPDVDIARCTHILNNANYHGYISLEYEAGGDVVEGTIKLMEDVVAALI